LFISDKKEVIHEYENMIDSTSSDILKHYCKD